MMRLTDVYLYANIIYYIGRRKIIETKNPVMTKHFELSADKLAIETDDSDAVAPNFLGKSEPGVLAERLSKPRRLDETADAFDRGDTLVRDVGQFTANERGGIINMGRRVQAGERIAPSDNITATVLRANDVFRRSITSYEYPIQSNAGWNLTVNAHGFKAAGLPWARVVDGRIAAVLEQSVGPGQVDGGIDALIHLGSGSQDNRTSVDRLAREVWSTASKMHPGEMAWYLAERSQFSENYQRDRYQREMTEAKRGVASLLSSFSAQYELPHEHRSRAMKQLSRADFSAFDHLINGVDAGDGIYGDYQSGTLRVETKLGGNVARPAEAVDPLGTTSHELLHATSAQHYNENGSWDVGLRSGDQGLDANEGMTELLNKLSLGRVRQQGDRYVFVDSVNGHEIPAKIYSDQVKSMFVLMHNEPELFRVLFNAYYGNIPDSRRLATAFERFNNMMQAVAAA